MSAPRTALVFGASGFIGRWLIRELLTQGASVVAAVRSERSYAELTAWLVDHGATRHIDHVLVDFAQHDLGVAAVAPPLAGVTEVYNVAGAYRFGMTIEEAREANVASSERIVALSARLPALVRLVHLSGYRVGGQDPSTVPWSDARVRREYAHLGAYEASKVESDAVVQAAAARLGVPWTIVNPASVIGDSATGESEQLLGIAGSVRDLWNGDLPALPGGDGTFVPVVTVDYLAAFMAAIPPDPRTRGHAYWILDDTTPALPTMLTMLAAHLGVRAPRLRIPVGLLRGLPQVVTRAHPETLSFLSSDRYPTTTADRFARDHGLAQQVVGLSLTRWADHLAAHRFGAVPIVGSTRVFMHRAGVHTLSVGDPDAATILLPGLPVNADTWAPVGAALDGQVLDLPGLGSSSGSPDDGQDWLHAVVGDRTGIHLVGHSVGAALALEYASRHPEKVARLTLVSPHFVQRRAPLLHRAAPVMRGYFARVTASSLATALTGDVGRADRLETSAADLRRSSAAATARLLRQASQRDRRRRLARLLDSYAGAVELIAGSRDPLITPVAERIPVHVIEGAGHHPQLTHAEVLADLLRVGGSHPPRQPAASALSAPSCGVAVDQAGNSCTAHVLPSGSAK